MPFVTRLPALTGADPYPDALLALDFVGARRGPQYYKSGGVTVSDITQIPGWTYTGGTPAGTGSYAPKADGSLQFFPSVTNLLLQSQTFDNASWTKSGSTISADATVAPDGTTTADKIVEAATTASHAIIQAYTKSTVSQTYTASYYVKADTRTRVAVWMNGAASGDRVEVGFNLSTGAILTPAATAGGFTSASATITALANGWYRVTLTGTTDASASVQSRAFTLDNTAPVNSPSYTGDGTSGIYIWGAQLELGSTASTYIPTTTAAVTVAPPRITDAGYLAEEARTNLLTYSSAFENASWTKIAIATLTADATTAPDGTATADLIIPNSANSTHFAYAQVTHTAASHTISVYAKPAGYDRIAFRENTTLGSWVVASLTGAGSILGSGAGTGSIVALANGWYRVSMTYTGAATVQQMGIYIIGPGYTSGSPLSYNWQGDGTSGVYFWNAQDELGSFATSPIPTTSVAVTRAADVGSIGSLVTPTAGATLFMSGQRAVNGSNGSLGQLYADVNNRVAVNSLTSNVLSFDYYVGGFGGSPSSSAITVGLPLNAAVSMAPSRYAGAANGVSVADTTTITTPTSFPNLSIGRRAANGDLWFNGPIRRIVIYPRAFGNSELQAITTAGAY